MPLPVIANTYRCALEFHSGPFPVVNVLHWEKAASDEADLLAALESAATIANPWEVMSGFFGAAEAHIIKLDGASATVVGTIPHMGGSGASEYLPAVCGTISLHSALRGPSGRGRVYVGPMKENTVENGFLTSSILASMQSHVDDFFADMTASGWTWVVASYVHGLAHPVTVANVRAACSTQRRRQGHLQ